jgi:hypothetical protein
MELNNLLWKEADNIQIKKLWEYLCTYCYLPRLADYTVLEKTIKAGLNSDEYFAFASGFDGSRYIDLKFNQSVSSIEYSGYLVKVEVAQNQINAEATTRTLEGVGKADQPTTTDDTTSTDNSGGSVPTTIQPKKTRFFMSADLNTTRINRDVQKLVEEIIQHLTSVDGASVKVSLEVEANSPDGFNQQTSRTISENCRALRVKDSGFED